MFESLIEHWSYASRFPVYDPDFPFRTRFSVYSRTGFMIAKGRQWDFPGFPVEFKPVVGQNIFFASVCGSYTPGRSLCL